MNTIKKSPLEEFHVLFDFTNKLVDGDTITEIVSIDVGSASYEDAEIVDTDNGGGDSGIRIFLSGGTVGNHNVQCVVTTANGHTYEVDGILKITDRGN